MSEVLYPVLFIVVGIVLSTVIVILLNRLVKKVLHYSQFYPESQGLVKYSLKFLVWFIWLVIVLLFITHALNLLRFDIISYLSTTLVLYTPKIIIAVILVLVGVFVSQVIRIRLNETDLQFKYYIGIVIEAITIITFGLTALEMLGVPITVFLELYKVILYTLGIMISLIVGIPIGISIYPKVNKVVKKYSKKGKHRHKRKR